MAVNKGDGVERSESVTESLILSYMLLPDRGSRQLTTTLQALDLVTSSEHRQKQSPKIKLKEHRRKQKSRNANAHASKQVDGNGSSSFTGSCVVAIPTMIHQQWTGILETLIFIAACKDFCSYTSTIAKSQRKQLAVSGSRRGVTMPSTLAIKKNGNTERILLIPKAIHKQWCTILEEVKSLVKEPEKNSTDCKEGVRRGRLCENNNVLPNTVYEQFCECVDKWDLAMTSSQAEKYTAALTAIQGIDSDFKDRREVRKSFIPKMDVKEEIEIPVPQAMCKEWSKVLTSCKLTTQGTRFTTYDRLGKRVGGPDRPNVEENVVKPIIIDENADSNDYTGAMSAVNEITYHNWCKFLDGYDVMVTSLGFKRCRVSLPKLPELEESEDGDLHSDKEEGDNLKRIILVPKVLHDNWFRALDTWNWLAESMGYDDGQTTSVPKLQLLRMHKSTATPQRDRICRSYIETSDESERFFLVPEVVLSSWLKAAHKEWSNVLRTGHSMVMAHGYESYKSNVLRLQEFKDHVYGHQVSSKPTTNVERIYQQWVKLKNTWNGMVTSLGYTKLTASIPNLQGMKSSRDSYLVEPDTSISADNIVDNKTVTRLTRVAMHQEWDSHLESWTLMALQRQTSNESKPVPKSELTPEDEDERRSVRTQQGCNMQMFIVSKFDYDAWSKLLAKWNTMVASLGYANYRSSVGRDAPVMPDHKIVTYNSEKQPKQGHLKGKLNRMIDSWNLIVSPKQCDRGIDLVPDVQVCRQSIVARLPMTLGGHGCKPGQFCYPCGVIINNSQKMVIADKDNHRLQILGWNGHCRVIANFNRFAKPFMPYDIAETRDGKYVITDVGNSQIVVCNEYDQVIRVFGQKEGINPRGIAVTSQDVVMVTDVQQGRSCIRRYTLNGQHIGVFGTYNGDKGQIQYPCSLAVNSQDDVIVPGNGYPAVQVYDSEGQLKSTFSTSGPRSVVSPIGIDVDGEDNIYVCDFWQDKIIKYSSDGQFVCNIGQGQVKCPLSVAVLSSCIIAVTEHHSHDVKVLDL